MSSERNQRDIDLIYRNTHNDYKSERGGEKCIMYWNPKKGTESSPIKTMPLGVYNEELKKARKKCKCPSCNFPLKISDEALDDALYNVDFEQSKVIADCCNTMILIDKSSSSSVFPSLYMGASKTDDYGKTIEEKVFYTFDTLKFEFTKHINPSYQDMILYSPYICKTKREALESRIKSNEVALNIALEQVDNIKSNLNSLKEFCKQETI